MKIKIGVFCVVLLSASIALSENRAVAAPQPEIKVGAVLALSGSGAAWGENARRALELAAGDHAAGKLVGRNTPPLKLIVEDSKSSPAQAVAAFHKLVEIDKVQAVIGDVWSFLTNPLVPLAKARGVLLVTPTLWRESAPDINEYVFSVGHASLALEAPFKKFFALNPAIKRLGIIMWNDAWGQAHTAVLKRIAAERNVVIVDELPYLDPAENFSTAVSRLTAKGVDAIFTSICAENVFQRLTEQRREAALLTLSDAELALRERKINPALLEGVYFADWRPAGDFLARYRERFHAEPVAEAQNSYEALRAVLRGWLMNKKDLAAGLSGQRWQGLEGPINFAKSQFGNKAKAKLLRISKGEVREVR